MQKSADREEGGGTSLSSCGVSEDPAILGVANFLCFKIIFSKSCRGDGKVLLRLLPRWPPAASRGCCSNNFSPKATRKIEAASFCCSRQQWSSRLRITGNGLLKKAFFAMTLTTSVRRIFEHSVFPWVTIGEPSMPSQRSISRHRMPFRSNFP